MTSTRHILRLADRLVDLSSPLVMAIVNATPDSFFASSRAEDEQSVRSAVDRAIREGADILDIGACSTRPAVQSSDASGAQLATVEQEWQRLSRALDVVAQMQTPVPISVDTFRPRIAQRAIEEYGVSMINDVSGGSDEMFDLVAQHRVAYVLTYNRSRDEQTTASILADTMRWLSRGVDSLHRRGVSDVIIDPGFGFGQTVSESLYLLEHLSALGHIGCPILAGISRKRMAYEPAGLTPDTCLNETLALEAQALAHGASLLRVHDVAPTVKMVNGK